VVRVRDEGGGESDSARARLSVCPRASGLGDYAPLFQAERIDGPTLLALGKVSASSRRRVAASPQRELCPARSASSMRDVQSACRACTLWSVGVADPCGGGAHAGKEELQELGVSSGLHRARIFAAAQQLGVQ
jgi:hypothetical protein